MKDETELNSESAELKNIFAQNLLFFRRKSNLSQKELADKLNTSNKNISKWERAETIPDILTMKKIAKIFNISVDILINPITNDNKKAITEKVVIPFKWKISVLMLINSIIFLLTCVSFFILEASNIENFKSALLFLYMLPLIDISIFVFLWVTIKKVDAISLSLFGWLVALCFYITFIKTEHIVYIFIIALAYQIIAPVFAYLINSRKIIAINKLLLSKFKKQNIIDKDEKEVINQEKKED